MVNIFKVNDWMMANSDTVKSNPSADLHAEAISLGIKYSVVIPVHGSENVLQELHRRLSEVMRGLSEPYEVIFVDDCGSGQTWKVLQYLTQQDSNIIAIQLMRNSGQSSATICGMAHARGQIILTIDDDLQHPPEEIPKLLKALSPEVDVAIGVPKEPKHHWFRQIGSKIVHSLNAYMLKRSRELRFTSFRAIRSPVVKGLLSMKTLNPALNMMINSLTQRVINVNVMHSPRLRGQSGYTLSKLFSLTMNNLVGYSMLPLRILGIIGGIGILLSILLALILLVQFWAGGIKVPGWTSTILLLLFLSGFNFFAFSILGEYLLRILQRVNCTPQYFIRNHIGDNSGVNLDKSQ